MAYLLMILVVFGLNLLPAFGPPTWTVLAGYGLFGHLNPVLLVLAGAGAAASGRLVLATGCRHLRPHLGANRRQNLEAAASFLTANRRRSVVGLLLFALSPIPSAQLFEAAGLMAMPLASVVAVFFAGRLVSYSVYVGGATAIRGTPLGEVVGRSLTGWWGIGLQVLLLAVLAALTHVDFDRLLGRLHGDGTFGPGGGQTVPGVPAGAGAQAPRPATPAGRAPSRHPR